MDKIGYWLGHKRDIFTPFQRWGVTWYIAKSAIIISSDEDSEVMYDEFIDNLNENIFGEFLQFGKVEKDIPFTIRELCSKESLGNKNTPDTPIYVVMNDFIPEKYIHYDPTFFVKGTKKGILTSSHPFKTHIDIPFENELDYEIAMRYKLWYPEIKFYFYPYEKGIHFNRLPKFFPLPIYPTKKNLSDFSPTHLAPRELVFYGEANQIDLLKIYNCFEFPFLSELPTYRFKVLPEFYVWFKDEFYNNLNRVEKDYEENMRDPLNFNNYSDADDWMDDSMDYWNID